MSRQDARKDHTRLRIGLLALGGASLLGGLNAALVALGVWAPVNHPRFSDIHGMVMTLGFMGTVIALERAQSLRQPWAYLTPATLGTAAIALLAGQVFLGQLLLIQGAALLCSVYLALWRRAPLPLIIIQVGSALMMLLAASFWLVFDITELIMFLASYLVLTIASERAELAALTIKNASLILGLFTMPLTLLPVISLFWPSAARLFGITLILLAAWLLRADVVRKMLRATGLLRYNAAALGSGYLWLIAAGSVWAFGGKIIEGPAYDLTIHATFLGFGVSMIMAHAPIIFPAVISRPLPYRSILWLPLAVLHVGLVIRFIGYFAHNDAVWHTGAIINVTALLIFVVSASSLVIVSSRRAA